MMQSFFPGLGSFFLLTFLFFTGGLLTGYPLTRYFDDVRRHRILLSPALGLAVQGAVSLPLFLFIPFTRFAVITLAASIAAICWLCGRWIGLPTRPSAAKLSWLWVATATGLSAIPAYSVAPHLFHGGIGFSSPIFDHEKVAIIDEMVRNGTPVRNPFMTMVGNSPFLNYYYGWYFLAAQASLISGSNGWASDIIFTGVTAFLSLAFMGWAALRFSGKASSAWIVLLLSLLSSLTPFLPFVLGPRGSDILIPEHSLESWIIQSAWVPQHLFSATVGCMALIVFVRLAQSSFAEPIAALTTGLLIAFSYSSSVWVGLTGLLPVIVATALMSFRLSRDKYYYFNITLSAATALSAVLPLALQQAHRLKAGKIITLWLFPVFTSSHSARGHFVNFVGYWLFLLPLFFGTTYLLTLFWAYQKKAIRKPWSLIEKAILAACILPLLVAETLHSVIATNDLGWRCVLISIMAMTIVAASTLSAHANKKSVLATSIVFLTPGLMTGLAFIIQTTATQALSGTANAESTRFLTVDRDMWRAVAAVTPFKDAVATNPAYEEHLTPWEGNISWAMLSNRATCTPPSAYLAAFAADATKEEQQAISSRIHRVFNATPQSDDFQILRDVYNCRTLLVVPSDALWHLPLTAPSPYFDLAQENAGKWRIYRAR